MARPYSTTRKPDIERNSRLPEHFRPLFWSYRFDELDAAKHRKTVIVRVLNYGTLADWRWLTSRYGQKEIARILVAIPQTEIQPRTRALASILFSIPEWNHAYRGAH